MADRPSSQPVRIVLKPATSEAGWRALWDWLLAPTDYEITGLASDISDRAANFDDAGPREGPPQPQEKQDVQDRHLHPWEIDHA